jgi:Tfp pilus assembly pilus retraction ATPase PilT
MISTGRKSGMQTMEQSLKELILNGRIDLNAADEHLQELDISFATV